MSMYHLIIVGPTIQHLPTDPPRCVPPDPGGATASAVWLWQRCQSRTPPLSLAQIPAWGCGVGEFPPASGLHRSCHKGKALVTEILRSGWVGRAIAATPASQAMARPVFSGKFINNNKLTKKFVEFQTLCAHHFPSYYL